MGRGPADATSSLSPAAMKPALTPVSARGRLRAAVARRTAGGDNLDPGRPVAYGFGWFLDPWRGHAAHVAPRLDRRASAP